MNAQGLIKHTSLAFTFILSLVILSKIIPNELRRTDKYNTSDIRTLGSFDIVEPNIKYGFALDTFNTQEVTIEKNQTFLSILNGFTQNDQQSYNIIAASRQKINLNLIRPGMKMLLLSSKQSNDPDYLIFEPDVYKYVVFDLNNPDNFSVKYRPIEKSIETVSGIMDGSLWETINKYDMDLSLASQMEDAMECAFDLSRASKGDVIKMVYEKNVIDGEEVEAGRLLAAYYKGKLGEKHVFYFDNGDEKGYFDQNGRPMKKSFLKAPVKYAHISSPYSTSRLHPILNRVIPHLGTDFAAPYGTPILAVADGVVEAASFTSGNGRFVKLKHSSIYSTQYLHMSRFASGIRRGKRVRQGQVIGYVGASGLATGPHVCFRFWKNGRQVNYRNLNLPAPDPMPSRDMKEFKTVRNDLMTKLAAISKPIPGQKLVRQNSLEGFVYEKP